MKSIPYENYFGALGGHLVIFLFFVYEILEEQLNDRILLKHEDREFNFIFCTKNFFFWELYFLTKKRQCFFLSRFFS